MEKKVSANVCPLLGAKKNEPVGVRYRKQGRQIRKDNKSKDGWEY